MSTKTGFSKDVFEALFLNEEVYFIESEFNETLKLVDVEQSVIEEITESKIIPVAVDIAPTPNEIIPLLILVDEISEANKVFLEKILMAVNLNLEKVTLLTTSDLKAINFQKFSENKIYQKILSFGVSLSTINMNIMLMPYENKLIENVWFLMAEKLVIVENDVNHKRRLWGCLQQLFK